MSEPASSSFSRTVSSRCLLLAADPHVVDAEADRDEEGIGEAADLAADDQRIEKRDEKKAGRRELADRPRRRSRSIFSAARRSRRGRRFASAAQEPAERMIEGAEQRRLPQASLSHRRHDASSTIQATNSGKLSPACAASSGTSDVRVMPGCVLTSSQMISPDPASS